MYMYMHPPDLLRETVENSPVIEDKRELTHLVYKGLELFSTVLSMKIGGKLSL